VAEDTRNQRHLILWTICMVALIAILLWSAYLSRKVLLLIYVSALFAIGFSPLVRVIEKQKLLPVGTRRFPRWAAILLIYLMILGALGAVALMVVPPLADQARRAAGDVRACATVPGVARHPRSPADAARSCGARAGRQH
jgi:predicted PurR-regulated permease PerM